jgi:hypothetical protein
MAMACPCGKYSFGFIQTVGEEVVCPECETCPPGTIPIEAAPGNFGSAGCVACPSHHIPVYNTETGCAHCHVCPEGTWTQTLAGQTECPKIPTPYPTAAPTDAPTASPYKCDAGVWQNWSKCQDRHGEEVVCGDGVTRRERTVVKNPNDDVNCTHWYEELPCAIHYDGGSDGPPGFTPSSPADCPPCTEYEVFSECSAPCCPDWDEDQGTCVVVATKCRSHVPIPDLNHIPRKFCGQEEPEDCQPCNTHQCVLPTDSPTKAPTKAPETPAPTERPHSIPVCNVLDHDIITLDANRDMHYVDPGATCNDALDGNLNRHMKVSGQIVNLGQVGQYTILYDCKNLAGVPALTCMRIVHIRDLTCPTCKLNLGPNLLEASFPFYDPGAVCTDTLDGPIPFFTINPVNTEATGTYYVTYKARDAHKNWNDGTPADGKLAWRDGSTCKVPNTYTRTVVVIDTLRPVIGLKYINKNLIHTGDNSDISQADIQWKNPAGRSASHFGPAPAHFVFGSLMTERSSARATYPQIIALASGVLGLALLATAAVRRKTATAETLV